MHEYHEFFCLVLKICEEICRRMEGNKDLRIPDRIVFIFFTKATHTLKAIGILYENTLPEEAQSLVRVLLETNINFCMFLLMLTDDPMSAVMRLLDAMILEKLKQQRASNFAGLELVPNGSTPEDFFNAEKEIASRYSEKDFNKLKQYGFSGISIEQRAIKTGSKEWYDIIYRNFSRNIHSTDYNELLLLQRPEISRMEPAYFESRDGTSYQVAVESALKMSCIMNEMFSLGLDNVLEALNDE